MELADLEAKSGTRASQGELRKESLDNGSQRPQDDPEELQEPSDPRLRQLVNASRQIPQIFESACAESPTSSNSLAQSQLRQQISVVASVPEVQSTATTDTYSRRVRPGREEYVPAGMEEEELELPESPEPQPTPEKRSCCCAG